MKAAICKELIQYDARKSQDRPFSLLPYIILIVFLFYLDRYQDLADRVRW